MERLLSNIEFFTYEGEVWYTSGAEHIRLTERDTEVIDDMIELLSTFYPKAYEALCEEYRGSSLNKRYYKYRIVSRFVKCNFAQHDNIPDVSADGVFAFEFVPCPLRGECRLDCVVCRPEFDHKLSSAELPVLNLWYNGDPVEQIADRLCLSPHTVHNHIRNAYRRIGVHSRSEFVKFASQNNLFQ